MPVDVPDFDLYRELEVHQSASFETIDAAFRSLAKRYHPDRAADPRASAQKMVRLNVAHEWLSDLRRRAEYDAQHTLPRPRLRTLDDEFEDDDADRLLPDAVEVIHEYDRVSASLLQRRLKVGYARAARLIDQLEARGYIGPFDGLNARLVLRGGGDSAESQAQTAAPSGFHSVRTQGPPPTRIFRCAACEDHRRPPHLVAFEVTTVPGAISTHWCGSKQVWTGEPPVYMKALADPDDWKGYLVLALWVGPSVVAIPLVGIGGAAVVLGVMTVILLTIRWLRQVG